MVRCIDETESDLRTLIEADFGPLAPGTDFLRALFDWFHLRARSIPQQPRKVIFSTEVKAKRGSYPAIDTIARELRAGGDLRPWLSDFIRTKKADAKADLMFNDWQVTHFHLGRLFRCPGKIKRTDALLFAFIAVGRAVLLDVQPHGSWTMTHLLRILLKVSPKDMPELRGIFPGQAFTEPQHLTLRMAGMTVPIQIDDRCFVPPGLGVSSSGDATRLVNGFQRSHADLRRRLSANDLPATLLRQLTSNLALPVRLGIRLEGGRIVAYDKNRRIDLTVLQSLR